MKFLLPLLFVFLAFSLGSCVSSYIPAEDCPVSEIEEIEVGTETWNGYSSTRIDEPETGGFDELDGFESASGSSVQDEEQGVEIR